MSHLCYLCLFVYISVQHILCCICVLFSFVHYVASSSGLSILNCPFVFCNVYFRPVSCVPYAASFFGRRISHLRYLYFLAYSGVQHILCCVFDLFFFVLFIT
jgi:hypothetical protein